MQALHGFASAGEATAYLKSSLFAQNVVNRPAQYLDVAPEVRIYDVV